MRKVLKKKSVEYRLNRREAKEIIAISRKQDTQEAMRKELEYNSNLGFRATYFAYNFISLRKKNNDFLYTARC